METTNVYFVTEDSRHRPHLCIMMSKMQQTGYYRQNLNGREDDINLNIGNSQDELTLKTNNERAEGYRNKCQWDQAT